ncbi:hypothetical protein [Vibrio alginolyticus]|uniref:hypothetical protein n=1 Tax=Vibrio alginolyticus TaxID=663 RepID=UPI0006CA78C7|nr:hypothetical protein [Vibrio alginolyticus]KPM98618.1 hypothetical protein AOG25_09285 [Vibrio alginolyticus]CAH7161012.1 conserved exported hypothetical protein [Vibrio chagasii]CAH7330322.1 conserved exported hypothetical protein [Vibrio chagasii]
MAYKTPLLSKIALVLTLSSVTPLASASALHCTDAEIDAFINNYKTSYNNPAHYERPSFSDFKTNQMVQNQDEESNLCDVLMNADYSIELPSWEWFENAYASLKAAMNGSLSSSGSVNYTQVIWDAIQKGKDKAWEKIKEGSCKLGQKSSKAINSGIDSAYEDAQEYAKERALENEAVQNAGITNFDEPIWKQVAAKETEESLGEYEEYGRWYEDDYWSEEGTGETINSLINDEFDKGTEEALDKHVEDKSEKPIDEILDSLSP